MVGPLGKILTDIFVDRLILKLQSGISKPYLYCHYVDDVFISSYSTSDIDRQIDHFNLVRWELTTCHFLKSFDEQINRSIYLSGKYTSWTVVTLHKLRELQVLLNFYASELRSG